jgi:TPR repeat protein
MYLSGEGVPSDPIEGLRWLRCAADQGDGQTLGVLAEVYRNGYYGVPSDLEEAERWDKQYRQTEWYRISEEKRAAKGANPLA